MRTIQHTEPEERKAPLVPIAEWLELSKEEREEQCPDSDTSYAAPVRRLELCLRLPQDKALSCIVARPIQKKSLHDQPHAVSVS